jgi:hypothetical protein
MSLLSADAAKSMRAQSGAAAVRQSVQQNAMQENSYILDGVDKKDEERIFIRNSTQNQFVANKNFIQQSNVWVDAEFKPELKQTEVNLKFASDEYFAIVNRERELAQYFALGEEVVVVWKNKVYRVTR